MIADWTTDSVEIAPGAIEIHVTGVTNPPTKKEITDYKIEIRGRYHLAGPTIYKKREETDSVLTTGLTTCEYESEEVSTNAIIGHDRISAANAVYRFRFLTRNIHPSTSGLQVTMPSGYALGANSQYTMNCLTG